MRNIPNFLSMFRIILVPVFVITYFANEGSMKTWAALVYAFAAFTDFLDGFIARKFSLITNLGKILDPLGDKMMTLAALLCITIDKVIPIWAVIVFFVKESLMGIGGFVILKRAGTEIPQSNFIGKLSTVIFFLVCVTLMLFHKIPSGIASILISVAIGFMLMALGSYIMTFTSVMKTAKNKQIT